MAIEDALDKGTEEIPESKFLKKVDGGDGKVNVKWSSREDQLFIPAIRACVEKWDLQNFPITDTFFPSSPPQDRHYLIRFLWSHILKVYSAEVEIPNE